MSVTRDRGIADAGSCGSCATKDHAFVEFPRRAIDDFLELGGDSLLASRILSRLGDVLHLALPVRAFFEVPTVAGQALALARLQSEAERIELAPLLDELESLGDSGGRPLESTS